MPTIREDLGEATTEAGQRVGLMPQGLDEGSLRRCERCFFHEVLQSHEYSRLRGSNRSSLCNGPVGPGRQFYFDMLIQNPDIKHKTS